MYGYTNSRVLKTEIIKRMEKVIVTGANGFIGSSLVKRLVSRGVKVVAVDICFANSRLPESDMIETVEAGVDEKLADTISKDAYDAFYHLAWRGVNGAEKADPNIQLANIEMAIACAKVCKKLNVKKLLCAGTVAENATFSLSNLTKTGGGMMYGVAKHACRLILEDYCKNIGLPFVWMQFSNIYGVGNKTGNLVSYTLGEVLAGNLASFGPAQQPYDFIYVDDLIDAVCRLGENLTDKSFYFIGSGNPRKLKDYLVEIGEKAGRADLIGIGLRPDDGIKYTLDMFDNADLVRAVGDYVKTPFEDGIVKTIEWMKAL